MRQTPEQVPVSRPSAEASVERIKKGAILQNIVFTEKSGGFGTKQYVNSAPGRKAIVAEGFTPVVGEAYTVKIVKDTNENDPNKGKFIAQVMKFDSAKRGASLTTEDWKGAETELNEQERTFRKGKDASAELYDLTKLTREDRGTDMAPENRVAAEALRREREADIIEGSLDTDGAPLTELARLRSDSTKEAMSKQKDLEKREDKLKNEEMELITLQARGGGSATQALRDVRAELEALHVEREELLSSSPEAFTTLHLKELRDYKAALEKGTLAETPYVEKMADDIEAHLRAGQPVFIYGHLGSGKTELAMHVARRLSEKGALIVSGAKDLALSELYGHQTLELDKIDPAEISKLTGDVEQEFKEWQKKNEGTSFIDGNRAHDRILQTRLAALEGGTVSKFFLGPVYRAMQEGRPIIIDEVNAIPHDVLISLNHILTRKPGDKVLVQQNSGSEITVKEGFGFILTGNLNQGQSTYVARQDMDPAFLSRLFKVEYDYLPQAIEGSISDAETVKESELFHLMLAFVMNRKGDIEAPKGSVEKLWNLAKAARIIQDVFAGKQVKESFYMQAGGARALPPKLKESVLSIRALTKLMNQWQSEGYRYEIDHYIYKEFISQSTTPNDRAYLYQLLKDRFGFFQSSGWEQNPNYGTSGTVASFEIESPEKSSDDLEFLSARDTVQYAFGSAPERTAWPNTKGK